MLISDFRLNGASRVTRRHSCACRFARAAVIVAWAFALAGACNSREASSPGTRRDAIVFGTPIDAQTLDPTESSTSESDALVLQLYEGLLAFDQDMHIVGGLAERWSVASDLVTWTFHLRKGVRFHDGAPLDASAVKFSLERALDPIAAHRVRPMLDTIARIEAVDEHTIRITTTFPFSALEPTLANFMAGIVSPAISARYGKQFGRSAEATSGTGPYKVASWKKDEELVLERNPYYWGQATRTKQIVYRTIPDEGVRAVALETGDVDVVIRVPPTALARLERNPDITVTRGASITNQFIRFLCHRKPLDDPRVRAAISYATNRRVLIDKLVTGLGAVPTGPLPATIRNSVRLGEIPYDPQRARQLLKEAGYPNGVRITITTSPRHAMGIELAEAVAAQLKLAGIQAEIQVLEWAVMRSLNALPAHKDPRDMFLTGDTPTTADADWALRSRYSSDSPINHSAYSNHEFDRVVVQAAREPDAERRLALYKRAQQIVYLEDPPALWLYDSYCVTVARRQVKDLISSPISCVRFERAYVD